MLEQLWLLCLVVQTELVASEDVGPHVQQPEQISTSVVPAYSDKLITWAKAGLQFNLIWNVQFHIYTKGFMLILQYQGRIAPPPMMTIPPGKSKQNVLSSLV